MARLGGEAPGKGPETAERGVAEGQSQKIRDGLYAVRELDNLGKSDTNLPNLLTNLRPTNLMLGG